MRFMSCSFGGGGAMLLVRITSSVGRSSWRGSVRFADDQLVEKAGGGGAEVAHRLADGGEPGVARGHHVVPAGDHDGAGDVDAGGAEPAEQPEGELVVGADEGVGQVVGREGGGRRRRRRTSSSRSSTVTSSRARSELGPQSTASWTPAQRSATSGEASGSPTKRRSADALGQQVLGERAGAGVVLGVDRVDGADRRAGDQDQLGAAGGERARRRRR